VLEQVGTQEYTVDPAGFRDRFGGAFGPDSANELSGLFGP
jgi:hypothetical protein